MLDFKKIEAAINLLSAEKKIDKSKLVEIIESAIKTAYKKDYWNRDDDINVKLNLENGQIDISIEKVVVDLVENPSKEIALEDAQWFELWDIVEIDLTDEITKMDSKESFGRIASQAARQVIIQKLQDTEKEKIYDLFVWKEGKVINMKIDLIEWWKVIFDYNWNKIVLSKSEQVSRDEYIAWARFYVYVAEVNKGDNSSSRVVLSRKRAELVSAIFAEFVPEVEDGVVVIDRVVRQAWIKTKILVSSNYDWIDPVWTLIWQKWMRVKSVMEELSWEKIDIIPNLEDTEELIKKALTPAKVLKVRPWDSPDSVIAYIAEWERAKALWKWWLNVNLASKLTWYKITIEEIKSDSDN